MKVKVVILAGGVGTRLWPLSRTKSPKQVRAFLDDTSIIQKTYFNLQQGFSKKDIYVATVKELAADISKQLKLPKSNLITEPGRRETAAAVGYATNYLEKKFPGCIVVVVSADHYISQPKEYVKVLKQATQVVTKKPEFLVTIGINPTYAETGYGYIQMGKEVLKVNKTKVFKVAKFKEKPSKKVAEKYLKDWRYLWNAGIFIFKADSLLKLYKQYLPDHLKRIEGSKKDYLKIHKISLDVGLIEKIGNVLVIPATFKWYDIGHWKTVADISVSGSKNAVKGLNLAIDSKRNLVYSKPEKLVATIGLDDTVIIDTEDALLICKKDRAQEVKKLVEEIKKKKLDKFL